MKKIFTKLISLILAYRLIIIWLILLILFGMTLFKINQLSNYESDEVYLEQQREELQIKRINIDNDLVEKLEALEETPINVTPNRIGTDNPFSP